MKVWDTVSLTQFYLFGSPCLFLTAEYLLQVRSAYPHFSAQGTNIFILVPAVHFCKPVANAIFCPSQYTVSSTSGSSR